MIVRQTGQLLVEAKVAPTTSTRSPRAQTA